MDDKINSINFYNNEKDKENEIISNLKITNDMLFSSVLSSDNELLYEFIKMCTDVDIKTSDIKISTQEHTISIDINSKSVRLDVYVLTSDSMFDIEMQNKKQKSLPKRIRYYQALMDLDFLKCGIKNKYDDLQNLYIIFVCNFNPCDALKDAPIITVDSFYHDYYNNSNYVNYNDDVKKIFINIDCDVDKISDNTLKSFIEFMKDGYCSKTKSKLVDKMKYYMDLLKRNPKWRSDFMLHYDKIQEIRDEDIYKCVLLLVKTGADDSYIIENVSNMYDIASDDVVYFLNKIRKS